MLRARVSGTLHDIFDVTGEGVGHPSRHLRCYGRFHWTYRPKSRASASCSAFGRAAQSAERHQSSLARSGTGPGRGRIGRRCGCLPGAWVETGHAALPGPGPNRGCSRLPHEPKRRENPLHRPGASTTRPPWPVDPEPAPPAGSRTAGRSVQRGRATPAAPCRGVAPRRPLRAEEGRAEP